MAKTAEAKPTVLDASLYVEAKAFKAGAALADKAKPETLIDSLAMVRDAARRLEVDYKDRTEKLKEKLAPFDAERRNLKKVFEGAEEKFEGRLLEMLKDKQELPAETNNGVRLTIALLSRIGLIDGAFLDIESLAYFVPGNPHGPDLIDKKYLKPLADCIDWKAVEKDMLVNAALKDAGEPPKYDVGFAQVTQQVSLRPKLPEV